MFPEHVERSFFDPEYSFDEYFQLGSRRNIRPIKNGLYALPLGQTGSLAVAAWAGSPLKPGADRKLALHASSTETNFFLVLISTLPVPSPPFSQILSLIVICASGSAEQN